MLLLFFSNLIHKEVHSTNKGFCDRNEFCNIIVSDHKICIVLLVYPFSFCRGYRFVVNSKQFFKKNDCRSMIFAFYPK